MASPQTAPDWNLVNSKGPDEWKLEAFCRGMDTEIFYPVSKTTSEAVQACAQCSVRPECLAEASRMPIQIGYWGGLTAGARYKLFRDQRRERRNHKETP